MSLQYKIRQLQNIFRAKKNDNAPVSWVFIYGLPRSGTTFVLHQFMKVAKAGIGDWELKEFAKAIENVHARDWVVLNTKEMTSSVRDNLLVNAPIGGGSMVDIVIKQINTTTEEFEFYKTMFKTEPVATIFMFREPNGWLPSAIEKFGIKEKEAIELYYSSIKSYEKIGGIILEYDNELPKNLGKVELLKNVKLDGFLIKRKSIYNAPNSLANTYTSFKQNNFSS